ncbi:MAG: hypothetical protein AAGA93_22135 [Actinomycetota bacterium]
MNSTSPGVPGYETTRVLGAGRSTIVLARRVPDGREVIVKLLDPASEPVLPKWLDRRRRALLRLSREDAGLVPLLDHGTAPDGRSFVVTPWLALGSLQDQIDRGPTPWFPASKLVAEVARTVGRLHDDDIAIGDLRPSKVLLETADTPLVSVFGMATRRFDDGGPEFRAPEAGNDQPPTPAADVYSLALILCTLVLGRSPGRGEPVERFLTEVIGLVPARILDVLEHGLNDSLMNRYGGATAMYRALQRAIEAGPDDESDDGAPTIDRNGEASPVDLDELLATSAPSTVVAGAPDPLVPSGLQDIAFVGTPDEEPDAEADESGLGDDRLLLPAGLDDIVLATPEMRAAEQLPGDETTPFPDADADAIDHTWAPPTGEPDGTETIDLRDDRGAEADGPVAPGSEVGGGSDVAARPGADETLDDDTIDDLVDIGAVGRSVGTAAADAVDSADAIDTVDTGARSDDQTDRGPGGDGHQEHDGDELGSDDEIVDLTELFTRTHEFVYDPSAVTGGGPTDGEDGPDDDDGGAGPNGTNGHLGGSPAATTAPDANGHTIERAPDSIPVPPVQPVAIGAEAAGTAVGLDATTDDDGANAVLAPAPPTMPARPPLLAGDDDPTDVFEQPIEANGQRTTDLLDDPFGHTVGRTVGHAGSEAGGDGVVIEEEGSMPFAPPAPSEAIPFPNMGRVRTATDDHGLLARARVRLELFWFRNRRRVATLAALLGLASIVAVVLFFAAREIQSSTNSISTEGVPQPSLTTATTGVNYVSTDAPFVTDLPPTTATTVAPVRRRPATTAAAGPSSATAPPTSESTTEPPTTERATTTNPPPTDETTTTRRRRTTTQPTTTNPPTTDETTTTRRRRTTTRPTTTNPPTTEETTTSRRRTTTTEATTTTDVLPPTTEDEDPPDEDDGAAAAPALGQPTLVAVDGDSASITYRSDDCVATQFRLRGSDGSVQSGASSGYDAAVQCALAWNLDFNAGRGSELTPGVAYTLTVTVKNVADRTASARLDFTTPT